MKRYFLSIVIAFAIGETSLAQVKDPIPPSYRLDQTNPMNIYRAEAQKINSLIHTKLDLKFDYEKEEVHGEAWITLKPHFYDTNQLTLDAKSMEIHSIEMLKGNSKKKLNFTQDDFQVFIDLDKVYNRNEDYTVYIKYTARPNEVKAQGSRAISSAKGLYFINPRGEEPNKPTQIWTQGEPESNSAWFPTIDKPNQKTSQEIYLTVPDQYVTLSNGKLEKQTKNSDGTRTDYWNFKEKHAPYLFFIGIGDFAVIKDQWKDIVVDYYVEHEYAPYAKDIFGDTPEMIQFFSDILQYKYPWNKYSQMVARDYVSGAMENTTAVLHQERAQQLPGQLIDENIWEGTIAHELIHHWFGNLVTTESWMNLAVNEAFANYSEYMWYEYKYGKNKAEEDRYFDLKRYTSDESHFGKDLIRKYYKDKQDMFDVVSYNKGGKGILHMLRKYLGDDAFFTGLSKYLHDNAYGTAEGTHIRLALEEVSGLDLNWFFDQWFYSNGHPQLILAYDYDTNSKKVKVHVSQTQNNYFEFPFAIDIVVDGKVKRENVWVSKKRVNTFEFDATKKPEVVIPNADQDILCEITDNKTIEEFIAQFNYGKDEFITRALALEALANAQSTHEAALGTIISALEDDFEGIRIQAINHLDAKDRNVRSRSISILEKLAISDPKTLVQAAAYEILNEMEYGDISLFEKGLKSQSFRVQAASAVGVLRLDPSRTSEFLELSDDVVSSNQELVAALLDSWIANNDQTKLRIAAEPVAFYLFAKFENADLGSKLERGFNWVLSSNDLASTKIIANTYSQVYKYYAKDNPSLVQALNILLDQAIQLKANAFQSNPDSSYEEQIKVLNEVKADIK